jgi:hypothetical protein
MDDPQAGVLNGAGKRVAQRLGERQSRSKDSALA